MLGRHAARVVVLKQTSQPLWRTDRITWKCNALRNGSHEVRFDAKKAICGA